MSLKEQLKYDSQEEISVKKLIKLWAEETGENESVICRFVIHLLCKDRNAFFFYDSRDSVGRGVTNRLEDTLRKSKVIDALRKGVEPQHSLIARRSDVVRLMKHEDAPIPNFLLPPSSRSNAKTTVPTSPLSKTEQRKASTQDRNDRWRDRFKELQHKHRKLSKKQIAKKMEKEPIAEGRPWSTILRVFNQAKTS